MAGSFGFEKEHYDLSLTIGIAVSLRRLKRPALKLRSWRLHLLPPADRTPDR